MSGRVHAEAQAVPKSSFVPVRTGLLAGSHGKLLVSQPPLIQAKLTINQPNDRYEQEADRVAEQVMRMAEPLVQRQPEDEEEDELIQTKSFAGQITPLVQRKVEKKEEEDEEFLQKKELTGHNAEITPDLESRIHALRGDGQSLTQLQRAFFEPRFGYDFSQVWVHTDDQAAESARVVNARAYTVGRDVVFGAGQYTPGTSEGRRLLAHELTHVVQQRRGGGNSLQSQLRVGSADDGHENEADRIASKVAESHSEVTDDITPVSLSVQRDCGPVAIGEPQGCTFTRDEVSSSLRYLFDVDCDVFAPGNDDDLRIDSENITPGETIEIHGFASIDGDLTFNRHLSCARALRAEEIVEAVLARRSVTATIQIFNHGATSGDATQQRSVVIVRTTPPPAPGPTRRCGPDVTDWFIRQVNAAKTDATILALQGRLAGAERVARRYGFSAEAIAEGAVARRVLAEETRVGSPPRTAEATSQFAASVPGQRAFGRAVLAATVPLAGAPEAMVLAAIRGAALTWKGLVGTGRKYDFKNDSRTLQSPTSANCPVNCANTLTLCPSSSSDCFKIDVPGNLFYAHIGRFVGWTELALQLGSQFAQLDASARWDPPEDTRMINMGFALPDPLTRSALCSAINANRSIFRLHECENCSEGTTADVV